MVLVVIYAIAQLIILKSMLAMARRVIIIFTAVSSIVAIYSFLATYGFPIMIPRWEEPCRARVDKKEQPSENRSAYFPVQQETLLKKFENDLFELYLYYSTEQQRNSSNFKGIAAGQFEGLIADFKKLTEANDARKWRKNRLQNLNNLMQKRLEALQNPADCSTARTLVCNLNQDCGFGCEMHFLIYCFMIAYGTERTMVVNLNARNGYHAPNNFISSFLPLSEKCTNIPSGGREWIWGEENKNDQSIILTPFREGMPFIPPSLPKEWADDLILLHEYPPAWFIGQFAKYAMRNSPELQAKLTAKETALGLGKESNLEAIVGLHVRRTDKLYGEMVYHSIEEYMVWADSWFTVQSLKQGKQLKKRVFIATDDSSVINETRIKYKEYEVIADFTTASSADVNSRSSDEALLGIISDVKILSKCDFVVCTFTSNVCRLAYELMDGEEGNATFRFHSLDLPFLFVGQYKPEKEAIIAHIPSSQDEIELQVGDIIEIADLMASNLAGFTKGQNQRTGKVGLYPSYKVKEKWRIEDFPTYPHVKL